MELPNTRYSLSFEAIFDASQIFLLKLFTFYVIEYDFYSAMSLWNAIII